MSKPLEKTHLNYIHVLRFVATYLVIMLHSITNHINNGALFGTPTWMVCNGINSIARMGVPLFFMISGYLSLSDQRTLDIKGFYTQRLPKILIPFFCWDVIYFVSSAIKQGLTPDVGQFFSELLVQGSQYHLWFVYQITGLYLLMPFLKRVLDSCSRRAQWMFLAVILLAPTLFTFVNVMVPGLYIAPFSPLVDGYVGFVVAGYLLGQEGFSKKFRWLAGLSLVAGLTLSFGVNYSFSSTESIYMIFNMGYAFPHYLAAGGCFLLVKWWVEGWKSTDGKIANAIRYLSTLSFGVYLSHVYFMNVYYDMALDMGWNQSPAQEIVCITLFTALFGTLLVAVLSKIKGLNRLLT